MRAIKCCVISIAYYPTKSSLNRNLLAYIVQNVWGDA